MTGSALPRMRGFAGPRARHHRTKFAHTGAVPDFIATEMTLARMTNLLQPSSLALALVLTAAPVGWAHAEPASAPKPAATQKKAEAAEKNEPAALELNDQDPTMKAAFKAAQASLDTFMKVHASNDPNIDFESVRVRISEGKVTEYVWIHPFEKTGETFKGRVNTAPTLLKKLKADDPVQFKRADIVDWMYFESKVRRMHGNYTTCAQLAKAPAQEVMAMKRGYGLDCSKNP